MHILYDAMIHEKLYEFYIQYFNQYVTIEISTRFWFRFSRNR